MIPRKERETIRAIRANCRMVIEKLEGDRSYLAEAHQAGHNTIQALLVTMLEFLERDMKGADREWEREGLPGTYDHNIFAAEHLSIYLAAWFSWVTKAKSKDQRRPVWQRRRARRASRSFLKRLKLAVKEGQKQVAPILRRRGEM